MARMISAEEKYGITVLIAGSSRSGTFGQASTTSTIIQYSTVMLRNGKTGRGQARRISWSAWVEKQRRRFGGSIPYLILVRPGTSTKGPTKVGTLTPENEDSIHLHAVGQAATEGHL